MIVDIIEFFKELNPDIIIKSPSRINLINPLDAVEGDFWMPSVAIEGLNNPLSVFVYLKRIERNSKIVIYHLDRRNNSEIHKNLERDLNLDISYIKDQFSGELKLVYGSLYRIFLTNKAFWSLIKNSNLEVGILSTIPRQSGLGGSASIIIALIYGFSKLFGYINNNSKESLNEIPINRDIIAEMATKVEDKDLKITAGYSDRYCISRGGLAFCSYVGKLSHNELQKEPLAIYDRIDKTYNIKELPIIVCYSGVSHKSGDVHYRLRKEYLGGNDEIIRYYTKLARIAWKSRFAIMKRDWKSLGQFFNINTSIMNNVMKAAGFKFGIGVANNILIDIIRKNKYVLAAKLTGAGGGGSVFALTYPEKIDDVLNYWKNELHKLIDSDGFFKSKYPKIPLKICYGLKNAEFFKIKINTSGVSEINL
ncbi:MAG: hypothetical protein GF317_01330 [Candidatus Lokiarchaeota archaeon]|nr:hypothetical protein [Candidatus Lokiarchaeota archaeon]MBD3198586.1 hypothetical protein [Candidatus Lokiarchaeota archaeon]